MSIHLTTRAVHHVSLTVGDVTRTRRLYIEILGFQVAAELPTAVLLRDSSTIVAIHPAPDPARTISGDRFGREPWASITSRSRSTAPKNSNGLPFVERAP